MKFSAVSFRLDVNAVALLYPSGTEVPDITTLSHECQNKISYGNLTLYDYGTSKTFDYSEKSEYNIYHLRTKETIRYCCRIDAPSKDLVKKYYPTLPDENSRLFKLDRDNDRIFFQFISYLGKTELRFGETHIKLPFEVVADKIHYEEEYIQLTQAIAEECSAILLDTISPTTLSFSTDPGKVKNNTLEQFIFLRSLCSADNIQGLFEAIKRNPDKHLIQETEEKPFGCGIPSRQFFKNPFSLGKEWTKTNAGYYYPQKITITRKYDNYDTPANRFIRFALSHFLTLAEEISSILYSSPESEYYIEALQIKSKIKEILQDSFFSDVGNLTVMPINNQVLEKREGYFQIYRTFALIDMALQLDWKGQEDVYQGKSKNTALLYEYWVFFILNKIFRKIPGCKESSVSTDNINQFISYDSGLMLSLKQGKTSCQSFSFDDLKLTVNLYYNYTFSHKEFTSLDYNGSYSSAFRPDYTIEIYSSEITRNEALSEGAVSYLHFDAKYRVTDITSIFGKTDELQTEQEDDYLEQEKEIEPLKVYKRGDLLKMHTYNDAIRRTIGSYVIYPGTEEKQYSDYDELLPGVGAFRLRPGTTLNNEKSIASFISKVLKTKSELFSRESRKIYFENLVIKNPTLKKECHFNNKSSIYMIGFMRNDYYSFLQDKEYIPKPQSRYVYSGKIIYFYYHAIRNGYVYPLHKDLHKAEYFSAYLDDPSQTTELHLEPWTAKIGTTKLISSKELQQTLFQDLGYNLKSPKADYYYLVSLENISIVKPYSIQQQQLLESDGNFAVSPFSPKIISSICL